MSNRIRNTLAILLTFLGCLSLIAAFVSPTLLDLQATLNDTFFWLLAILSPLVLLTIVCFTIALALAESTHYLIKK